MCVSFVCCCWLVPIGSASLQPRGRGADLVPSHWMCFGELLLLFLLFQLVMMTRWLFVGGGRSGGGSSYSCLLLLSWSSSKKTGKRVVFSIVDVTRLLAVRHRLIHAHTTAAATHAHRVALTLTHAHTNGSTSVLVCVLLFSLCVGFYLFLLVVSGYFMILSITLIFFFFFSLLFITCYQLLDILQLALALLLYTISYYLHLQSKT